MSDRKRSDHERADQPTAEEAAGDRAVALVYRVMVAREYFSLPLDRALRMMGRHQREQVDAMMREAKEAEAKGGTVGTEADPWLAFMRSRAGGVPPQLRIICPSQVRAELARAAETAEAHKDQRIRRWPDD